MFHVKLVLLFRFSPTSEYGKHPTQPKLSQQSHNQLSQVINDALVAKKVPAGERWMSLIPCCLLTVALSDSCE